MSITADDLRAAVQTGTISEKQAAAISALAETRRGVRENMDGLDEPFELFRGFNEIFIVVGLIILYAGWSGLTGLNAIFSDGSTAFAFYGAIGMGVIAFLARYFTLTRRMVAPSIALVIMFGLSSVQLTAALTSDGDDAMRVLIMAGLTTVFLLIYWMVFHVPFAMFLIGLGVFVSAIAVASLGQADLDSPMNLFLLSADGPFAYLTFALGILGLIIALRFDMSDPHRVTRRSQNGFWLHIIAAPAIINTVALTLFESRTSLAELWLFLFLVLMALLAIVIDRRSFLVSGVGYAVALAFAVVNDNGFVIILLLGLGMVILGAKWETLRRGLMRSLPSFPGRDRLPPWEGQPSTTGSSES
ncbi:hypothetical protein ACMU_01695 [Actibacterium mucosum KCTC 23349]|uniref:DUF2157 domain-containing protein n=1 Tax=Actibacterium mucosum KCTC 23349 TaxID=1454373 RepID=A0A037ZNV0_9RHOB|nr:hypothetical protein [Actibacterium mucosum]KAJ57233.1 hypothetical protein ACMU_01695 [Actibacterium mucosum KCTC 23349]